jgi:hypothetical protein
VASSNLAIVALEHRPNAWLRLGAQAYARDFDGLALVAPRGADPFATDGFVAGTGDAHGFALEVGASSVRYGFLASYGYQSVNLGYAGGQYVPEYGATHSIEPGRSTRCRRTAFGSGSRARLDVARRPPWERWSGRPAT